MGRVAAYVTTVLVAACLVLSGCGTSPQPDAGPSSGPSAPEETTVTAINPVWDMNFPDPQIIGDEGDWIAVSTNGNGSNVQTLTSTDLITWEAGPDALPQLPDWSTPGKVWAPEAAEIDGRWVMYYTTRAPDPEVQCVGRAVADTPEGPYVDDSTGPLVCQTDQGGSIDASPFVDADGTAWLAWKNDGNAIGVDTWLWIQPLSSDGLELTGEPTRLFKQDQPWEGNLVEAPYLWVEDGRYHLFYSGNDYGSADYAVGHAVADSPTGPWTKDPEPVLVSSDVAAGPGHCSLFRRGDEVWMVYHAWAPDAIGGDYPGRTMWLSRVTFDGDAVTVAPPATEIDGLG